MSATNSTTHYELPIYQPDDTTSWLVDFNGAMEKIDAAIYAAAQGGGGGSINVVQTTGQSTTDVMSQSAVTQQLETVSNSIPNVVQTTGNSETDTMSQAAITSALASAGGIFESIEVAYNTSYATLNENKSLIKLVNGEQPYLILLFDVDLTSSSANREFGLKISPTLPEGYQIMESGVPAIVTDDNGTASGNTDRVAAYMATNYNKTEILINAYKKTTGSSEIRVCGQGIFPLETVS